MVARGEKEASEPGVTSAVLAVLGAIGSGAAVLAFLVFVGGWVALARYRGEGLSGVVSVSLVPRGQLLASGADQLFVPFLVASTVTVAGTAYVLLARWLRRSDSVRYSARSSPVHKAGEAAAWLMLRARALPLLLLAFYALSHFQSTTGHHSMFNTEDFGTTLDATILVLLVSGAAAYWLSGRAIRNSDGWPRKYGGGFLATVFLAAMAVGALQTIARNEWNPPVQPLAILRKELPAVAGIYVGEDSSHVYVGVIASHLNQKDAGSQLSTRLVTIDRQDIAAIERGNTAFRIGGLRNADRDPTLLTAAQAGMLEDMLLPAPPRPTALRRALNVSLRRAALEHAYAARYGRDESASQRHCVMSVFGAAAGASSDGELDLSTAGLAEFLFLLRNRNPTATQMLDQLELTCEVDGRPAFT